MRRPSLILINGAFGVGKSTVARLLRSALADSAIYDPEWAGFVLQRAPGWLRLRGAGTGDFQDMPSWRSSVALGTRLASRYAKTVIIPMTFDNATYYEEVWSGLRAISPAARAFCLTAPLHTIRARLYARGTDPDQVWLARRVRECIEAHASPRFGTAIDTERKTVDETVREIIAHLARGREASGVR
jgi:predicted kinase